jgi:hypothetical protein
LQNGPSRLDSVKAGWEFPGYVAVLQELDARTPADREVMLQGLQPVRRNLERVFRNPTFPLDAAVAEYQAGRGSNEVLDKAFYGLPDYVLLWFRLGQSVIVSAHNHHPLGTLIADGHLASLGIEADERHEITAHLNAINHSPMLVGMEHLVKVDHLIRSIASREDQRIMKTNPWISGSFWLFSLITVVVVIRVIVGQSLNPWWIPVVITGGLLATILIGILTLRTNQQLKEAAFVQLIGMVLHALPVFGRLVPPSKNVKPETF